MTSVSLEVMKLTPSTWSPWRSDWAFVRLPLCAMAIVPSCGCSTVIGCAFSSRFEPVVE